MQINYFLISSLAKHYVALLSTNNWPEIIKWVFIIEASKARWTPKIEAISHDKTVWNEMKERHHARLCRFLLNFEVTLSLVFYFPQTASSAFLPYSVVNELFGWLAL